MKRKRLASATTKRSLPAVRQGGLARPQHEEHRAISCVVRERRNGLRDGARQGLARGLPVAAQEVGRGVQRRVEPDKETGRSHKSQVPREAPGPQKSCGDSTCGGPKAKNRIQRAEGVNRFLRVTRAQANLLAPKRAPDDNLCEEHKRGHQHAEGGVSQELR
eukprot:CAMPEP_0168471972 /NCGR_PEP_ID=MMETSP0228-20121227/59562_1 /TAXON_ID=133427 /ORGANISM="Protoceratium reticulatum, Strain CCCM 535 (=CCMP 1889)" /LENGTH=161 /DNA_ID=CAMNT_0008487907 /DNA_START=41 /DNA_END=522 /DNA_ORIENTATION=-